MISKLTECPTLQVYAVQLPNEILDFEALQILVYQVSILRLPLWILSLPLFDYGFSVAREKCSAIRRCGLEGRKRYGTDCSVLGGTIPDRP